MRALARISMITTPQTRAYAATYCRYQHRTTSCLSQALISSNRTCAAHQLPQKFKKTCFSGKIISIPSAQIQRRCTATASNRTAKTEANMAMTVQPAKV